VREPVALVTGASRGIGRAIAASLAGAGFRVAGVGRPAGGDGEGTPGGLASIAREIAAAGGIFLPVVADVADLDAHPVIVGAVEEAFGGIDVFVSNAGIAPTPRRDVLDMTPGSFDRVLGVNLRGSVFLAQRVARQMLATPGGGAQPRSLIFITSISAAASSPERAEYCISKAGASMAARVLADRLAGCGISVFEVRPGLIRTDMTAPAQEKYDRRIEEGLVPQGRWGETEDVARAVLALARGDFRYSTGTVVHVDGGLGLPRL